MGKENCDIKYSGPIPLKKEVDGLQNLQLRILESYEDDQGFIAMSGLFLSAVEKEKESMIGFITFSSVDTKNKIAYLHLNSIVYDDVSNLPMEASGIFDPDNRIWCSKMALLIISEENKKKGLGKLLLLKGIYHMKELGIDDVIIRGVSETNKTFYEKHGAEYRRYVDGSACQLLVINTNVITQYEDYLKEVVQR